MHKQKKTFHNDVPCKDLGSLTEQQTAVVDQIHQANGFKTFLLYGVTGSGKTYSMACVIESINSPTLVIAHNKTLAAQLATEFKEFFPRDRFLTGAGIGALGVGGLGVFGLGGRNNDKSN